VSDYWDEVFTADGLEGHAALDDQSAFIASLGSSRSPRMRDVLGTIAADQDAIIRAGSRGALVVDGGPGTGKTVVALHRSAYLLYSDPRLGHRRGGVLFVGPHQPYLAYVSDVLPSLGEEGVQICTLRDLVAEGAAAATESDPEVARLKSSADLVRAIEVAVRFYENPPVQGMTVQTPWSNIWLSVNDWAEAFDAPDPGTPHNEARDQIWEELLTILMDSRDDDVPADLLRRSLLQNRELRTALNRAWPLIEPADLVADLWSVPAYLRLCAPWLGPDEVQRLQRENAQAWTVSDLPLLDAARQRLGDPEASRRNRRHDAAVAAEREHMARVVDNLIEAADDEYGFGLVTMLRGEDFQDALVNDAALPGTDPDLLAGPFAHIVVDEAQELTDAEWQMLLLRCPSRSFTIVGDRAQARHGFTESWQERLERIGLDQINLAALSINYRTPEEVMAEAEPVIRAVLPDANVPISIRSTGVPVSHGSASDLGSIVGTWLAEHADGIACVIGDPTVLDNTVLDNTALENTSRVRSLTPELSKGLEFDLVVLIDPETFGTGIEGAVDRYVAMTRATQQLVILTSS
ncbi:MAG: RNA polymerase recycling motor ATPase HelR, partial [Streptosporangiaceae bacterium]